MGSRNFSLLEPRLSCKPTVLDRSQYRWLTLKRFRRTQSDRKTIKQIELEDGSSCFRLCTACVPYHTADVLTATQNQFTQRASPRVSSHVQGELLDTRGFIVFKFKASCHCLPKKLFTELNCKNGHRGASGHRGRSKLLNIRSTSLPMNSHVQNQDMRMIKQPQYKLTRMTPSP